MPVRVTESEGWRVTQIYGERERVGSRREVTTADNSIEQATHTHTLCHGKSEDC